MVRNCCQHFCYYKSPPLSTLPEPKLRLIIIITHAHTAGATVEGNDLSLFYGSTPQEDEQLVTITDQRRFLPAAVYGPLVRDTVVCCVDILLVRIHHSSSSSSRRECLLVQRGSEPAKGLWWLPGGRLLKGETFFAAAQRKAWQETGLEQVRPIQVLGVWNTFFPKSRWDDETSQGTQTVNPIVLVEISNDNEDGQQNDSDTNIRLDEQSENYRWIGLDPAAAEAAGEDKYVVEALYRLEAWDPNYVHRRK